MATRLEFLAQVWRELIDPSLDETWIRGQIEEAARDPEAPFAEVGPALQRLLDRGADPRDIALVARQSSYEAAFGLLYMLDDPGVDDGEMLHEDLLGADPSGTEGRRAPRGKRR